MMSILKRPKGRLFVSQPHNPNIIYMAIEKNNTYGEKTKRGKNKSSELLKEQLHKIANTVVNELDLGRLTNNQRIQLIKAVLPYLISKQKNIEDLQQEQPLFQIVSKN